MTISHLCGPAPYRSAVGALQRTTQVNSNPSRTKAVSITHKLRNNLLGRRGKLGSEIGPILQAPRAADARGAFRTVGVCGGYAASRRISWLDRGLPAVGQQARDEVERKRKVEEGV